MQGDVSGSKQQAAGLEQDEPIGEIAAYFSAASPEALASKAASFRRDYVTAICGSGSSGEVFACRYGLAFPKMLRIRNPLYPSAAFTPCAPGPSSASAV